MLTKKTALEVLITANVTAFTMVFFFREELTYYADLIQAALGWK